MWRGLSNILYKYLRGKMWMLGTHTIPYLCWTWDKVPAHYYCLMKRCFPAVSPGHQHWQAGEALPGATGGTRPTGQDHRGQLSQAEVSQGRKVPPLIWKSRISCTRSCGSSSVHRARSQRPAEVSQGRNVRLLIWTSRRSSTRNCGRSLVHRARSLRPAILSWSISR